MIEPYERIFGMLNQAMRDDPMLQELPPEIFDQIMESWKGNLEKKGIVKKGDFVRTKGFYSAFRDKLDRDSALYRYHSSTAAHNYKIDDVQIVEKPQLLREAREKDIFDFPLVSSSGFVCGRESVFTSRNNEPSMSQDRDNIRASVCRESIGTESHVAQFGGRDQKLVSNLNSFSAERVPKVEKTQPTETLNHKPFASSSKLATDTRVKVEECLPPKKVVPKIEISISLCDPDDPPTKAEINIIDLKPQPVKQEFLTKVEPKPSLLGILEGKRTKIEAEDSDEDLFCSDSSRPEKIEPQEQVKLEGSIKMEVAGGEMLGKRDPDDMDDDVNDDEEEEDDDDLFAVGGIDMDEYNRLYKGSTSHARVQEQPKNVPKTIMDMKIEAALQKELEVDPTKIEDGKDGGAKTKTEGDAPEEEELNSNDDVSEYNDDFDTGDNLLLGFYVKSKRKKDKRKIIFKNCVLRINGQEQIISEARGEFKWASGIRDRR